MTAPTLARPALVSPELLARQFARLADWSVQTLDDRAFHAAHALGGSLRDFDALCEAAETLMDLADGVDVYGPAVDVDRADQLAAEAHADALAPLVAAAVRRAGGAR